jgi:hypothetical protein
MWNNTKHRSIQLAVAGLLTSLFAVADTFAQECYIPFVLENRSRHVFGSVNTECSNQACHWYWHTPAWGNWGVDSNYGSRGDGTQFMGWKSGSGISPCGENIDPPQWNSCTDTYTDPYYFNYNNNTEQWSPDEKVYVGYSITFGSCPWDWDYDGVIDDGGCGNGTGWRQFSSGGNYMALYELDPITGDEEVTTLYYNDTMYINVWCDGWTCGSGSSSWQASASNSIASADIRFSTPGAVWYDPYNCCDNGVNYCQ